MPVAAVEIAPLMKSLVSVNCFLGLSSYIPGLLAFCINGKGECGSPWMKVGDVVPRDIFPMSLLIMGWGEPYLTAWSDSRRTCSRISGWLLLDLEYI